MLFSLFHSLDIKSTLIFVLSFGLGLYSSILKLLLDAFELGLVCVRLLVLCWVRYEDDSEIEMRGF